MYIPQSFRESRIEVMHELMRAHPLGMLISHGPGGLQAAPVPFVTYADGGADGTLRAHVARANPLWQELPSSGECLVLFQGTHGYVTPSWYPGKQEHHRAVPTWNYATVQAWGTPQVITDAGWLRRQLDDLTLSQEGARAQPWAPSDAPDDYLKAQMQAIVGIEIAITRIEGKWKMSQNRNDADRTGVINGLRADDDPHRNSDLADLVEGRLKG